MTLPKQSMGSSRASNQDCKWTNRSNSTVNSAKKQNKLRVAGVLEDFGVFGLGFALSRRVRLWAAGCDKLGFENLGFGFCTNVLFH